MNNQDQEYALAKPDLITSAKDEPFKKERTKEVDTTCFLDPEEAPIMTRCRCDDSPTEYITCHVCGFIECEYYAYRYKSSVYCNVCAYEVCGQLIEKPKFAFNQHKPTFFECKPVLAIIDCFKELQVYPQLYECLDDLVDYFGPDYHRRYD